MAVFAVLCGPLGSCFGWLLKLVAGLTKSWWAGVRCLDS